MRQRKDCVSVQVLWIMWPHPHVPKSHWHTVTNLPSDADRRFIAAACSRSQRQYRVKKLRRRLGVGQVQEGCKGILDQNIGLGQTRLLKPEIPEAEPYSRDHSHSERGYFTYLLEHNITSYSIRYWDRNDRNRFVEVRVRAGSVAIEALLLPWEHKRICEIFEEL